MRLDELKTGQKATIVKILGHGAFRKRLIEMGFVKGQEVTVVLHAPLRDPIKYSVMGYEVSLRRAEANLIEVVPVTNEETSPDAPKPSQHVATAAHEPAHDYEHDYEHRSKVINVALIGNPNCGKTSLFNIASGAKEHVGNYSGVTVDAKTGTFYHNGYRINLVDLPGTYSLTSYSPEELYVRQYLREQIPDVIINVVVASNLERNLYLTTDLISMDRKMVIALNMYDELQNNGDELDYELLGKMLGVPIVPTVSKSGKGINELFDRVIDVYEDRDTDVRHVHVSLGHDTEAAIRRLVDMLKADGLTALHVSPRFLAIKLLERDSETEEQLRESPDYDKIIAERNRLVAKLEASANDDITSIIANEKYGFISGALAETLVKSEKDPTNSTNIIDSFVTNKLFGFPLFLLVMFVMFWTTFEIGSYPMGWIEEIVAWLGNIVRDYMPAGPLKDMIADGIIGGVGGVIVFLPNILILYLFISFMEDSGYMARAAFIMDKFMHHIGLHGKSFIPLVMGFGCNVPAIMACRSIESRSSRIITMLINPFMSCSARLPVYVLLIGTFFDKHAALVFLGLYLIGILVAMMTARLLRRFWFHADETPFVMELPPYRIPTFKALMRHMWGKGEQYLRKMGGVILIASIIVWALNYFPLHNDSVESADNTGNSAVIADDSAINPATDSYLEMAGKAINPIMTPLGFHWRATVAALAGVPAKEIVVSTLGVLYTGEEDIDDSSLSKRITAPNKTTGRPDFTPAAALAFMIFILLYCPCIASVTAIVKETGKWQYGLYSVLYNTAVAWVIAFVVYRIALLF